MEEINDELNSEENSDESELDETNDEPIIIRPHKHNLRKKVEKSITVNHQKSQVHLKIYKKKLKRICKF